MRLVYYTQIHELKFTRVPRGQPGILNDFTVISNACAVSRYQVLSPQRAWVRGYTGAGVHLINHKYSRFPTQELEQDLRWCLNERGRVEETTRPWVIREGRGPRKPYMWKWSGQEALCEGNQRPETVQQKRPVIRPHQSKINELIECFTYYTLSYTLR